jgi:hypothetical protein
LVEPVEGVREPVEGVVGVRELVEGVLAVLGLTLVLLVPVFVVGLELVVPELELGVLELDGVDELPEVPEELEPPELPEEESVVVLSVVEVVGAGVLRFPRTVGERIY